MRKSKKSLSFLILLIFSLIPLNAQEQAIPCDFFTLEKEKISHQWIQIRGFLYLTEDSELVLAGEPNLKSCCIGKPSKREKQLLLTANIDKTTHMARAVTLKGNLDIDPSSRFFALLTHAVLVTEEDQSSLLLLLIGSISFIAFLGLLMWKRIFT